MSLCACGSPKLKGRGHRYCALCFAESKERKRLDAIRRWDEWREQNPERVLATRKSYYQKTQQRQRDRARTWYWANRERASATSKAWRENNRELESLKRVRKYNLSPDEYRALLARQDGGCAICGRTENGKRSRLDVDHNHETGEIRGLLCNRCNRLLSNAQDSIGRLEDAAVYLRRHLLREVA